MPRTHKILQSLNKGELSPQLDMRIDQQAYQAGCRTMENAYPLIYGGAERRPGSYFAGKAKQNDVATAWTTTTAYVVNDYVTNSNSTYICETAHTSGTFATDLAAGKWAVAGKVRVMDFVFSVDQAYVLEFGNQYLRIFANSGRFVSVLEASVSAWADATSYYAGDMVTDTSEVYRCLIAHTSDSGEGDGNGGDPTDGPNTTQWKQTDLTSDSYPIYEIPTPYLTADLFALKVEQSADVMYITHPSYEPRKLSRTNATTFVLEELAYPDGPFQTVNTVSTAKIACDATTGTGITLTASGTNADGSTFQPFKTGTTAGHRPSGATGDANAGTPQTYKSITGALFKIIHTVDESEIDKSFSATGTSDSLLVYKGVKWDFVTNGTWTGTIKLERSYDQLSWETMVTCVSQDNNNVQSDGTEESDDAYYRINCTDYTSGTATTQLSVRDTSHIGVVEITAVASTTSATATVLRTIGSTTATQRWAEGYWSNYRGWPNAVAISTEERLTFAGSASFPLTVWGSKSGDYTDMTAGTLDDDAIIFTLVGSGRQNEIRWIVTKNAQFLGTYGGEHLLGATDDKEALTPTNVTAKLQSTYGSQNVQPLLVGDVVLFLQRGGRRLREMHYDFEKDAHIAENLTVFAEHITESGIVDMAYQRTPDPMVWCVRDDGELAILSYERSQDVWSWCRSVTADNTSDSDYESVCVIPSTGEEDVVWYSVKRTIGGSAVRYIEYFAPRDF